MKLWSWLKNKFKKSGIVAVIRLEGVISTGGRFGGGINDQSLSPLIEKAFELGRLKAVALIVNSPGGSPSQSSLIAARIISYQKRYTCYSFCEDVAASGDTGWLVQLMKFMQMKILYWFYGNICRVWFPRIITSKE